MTLEESAVACAVDKEHQHATLHDRSAGFFFLVFPCGFIAYLAELYRGEGAVQVLDAVCNVVMARDRLCETNPRLQPIETIVYDAACRTLRVAQNPLRCNRSVRTQRVARLKWYVDRLHRKNHKTSDVFCRDNCTMPETPEFKINTQACESLFSRTNHVKTIIRHMSKETALFFMVQYVEIVNDRHVREKRIA
jgi:hypothetical protein